MTITSDYRTPREIAADRYKLAKHKLAMLMDKRRLINLAIEKAQKQLNKAGEELSKYV